MSAQELAESRQRAAMMREQAKAMHQHVEALREQTRKRKARFDKAHAKGMKALRAHDFVTLSQAIQEESALIEELLPPARTAKQPKTPRKPARR